jgi:hypothetical protein
MITIPKILEGSRVVIVIASPCVINSNDWDTSDSYPYEDGSRFIFYVTGDVLMPHGGYNLALADLKTKKRWDIDKWFVDKRTTDINSDLQELGPAWSPVVLKP